MLSMDNQMKEASVEDVGLHPGYKERIAEEGSFYITKRVKQIRLL